MEQREARLLTDVARDATLVEVERLRRENGSLNQLVTKLSLDMLVPKEASVPELD
jgi:hypothetical protein